MWLFPVIFIFHDMEEVIGYGLWLRNNQVLLKKKYQKILIIYKDFSTEGFSVAVYEELILCIAFSTLALLLNTCVLWYMWLGGFVGCTLHFLIHIGQSIVVKQYIPATITSIICFPLSVWIVYLCFSLIWDAWWYTAIWVVLGIVLVAVNLKFAQRLIGWFTRKMGLTPVI